jgi:hypothetical protein
MEKMILIKKQALIKSIVTEDFKTKKAEELQKSIVNNEKNLHKLQDHIKNNLYTKARDPRLEEEMKKMAAINLVMKQQLDRLKDMKIGDYFTENAIEGFVSLKKGDNVKDALKSISIIVKDDKVLDFEEG